MAQTRKILLIVSGGIAAYKAANLVRHFRKQDAEVRVVMTRSAEEFIAPMTLQVLSENKVGRGLFEPGFEYEIGHIELARWPDVVLVDLRPPISWPKQGRAWRMTSRQLCSSQPRRPSSSVLR